MSEAIRPLPTRLKLHHSGYCGLAKFSIPRHKPIIAMTSRIKPPKSKRCTVGSVIFGIALKVINAPSRPIGRLIRKIQCQDRYSTIQPPKVGPIRGPIKPARLIRLMADRNWVRGIIFSVASRPTGSSKAPPIP